MKINTITLNEAVKMTSGPLAFNLMIKPAGSLCNLSCKYCYYLDKSELYGGLQPKMSVELLEKIVCEYIAANDVPEITFNWHGGEPLVMGLDFYRMAVEFQRKYSDGKIIHNTLQTNGTMIDHESAEFFRQHEFLIGISIDGPKHIHDRYRRDRGGRPTFDKVMRGLKILQDVGVEYNTMSAVSKASEGRGLETYQFLKSIGSCYMQFMPVMEMVNGQIGPWSVSSEGFGRFMCDIFDHWVQNDVGRYFVNMFDATLANHCGLQPGLCIYGETCGGNIVIEHNGDVYPCDHFVKDGYLIGNINKVSLRDMASSREQFRFGLEKRNSLPKKCLHCEFVSLCRGECPKHRFDCTEDAETGLSSLCEGYRMFYKHTAPYMLKMKEQLLSFDSVV
jgi:uncharacterized protein